MKTKCGILVLILLLFTGCASTPTNPGKPEMSVPENSPYNGHPKTFNQFHNDWDY